MPLHLANDVLLLDLPLEAPQRALEGFVISKAYLSQVKFTCLSNIKIQLYNSALKSSSKIQIQARCL